MTVVGDLLDTTDVVFVAGAGGRVVKALADALSDANVRGGAAEKLTDVLQRELDRAGLSLRGDAARVVLAHLGDDAGRIGALVDLWASTFGAGAHLELDDVTPYLNDVGSVRPFELTNRIEEGDVAGGLEILHRLLTVTSPTQPKPMHPLQVLGILAGRVPQAGPPRHRCRRPRSTTRTGSGAARAPTRRRRRSRRRVRSGPTGFARAFAELHRADIGIKGATGLPEGAVLEITVARLANLHRGGRGHAGASAPVASLAWAEAPPRLGAGVQDRWSREVQDVRRLGLRRGSRPS